jgi:hypothetical protein
MKSLLLFLILVFITTLAVAKDYFVDSELGLDTNNGTSPEYAWQTLGRVKNASLVGGDRMLFARGRSWRGSINVKSGQVNNPLIYDAYGEGPKPRLMMSLSLSNESDWEQIGPSLWRSTVTFPTDVGNIVFNHFANATDKAYKVINESLILSDNQFAWSTTTQKVVMKSTENPARLHYSIEAAYRGNIISITANNVVVRNLELIYGGSHGIQMVHANNITVTDCDILHIGGSILSGTTRYGNGIEMWTSNANILIANNTISQVYDTATTAQGYSVNIQHNIRFENNYIFDSEQCFELWNSGNATDSVSYDIYFVKNSCVNMGRGWSHFQRELQGYDLLFYRSNTNLTNVYITGNVFAHATEMSFWANVQPWPHFEDINFDANCWWPKINSNRKYQILGRVFKFPSTSLDMLNISDAQAYFTNFTSNNVFADPDLQESTTGQLVPDPQGACRGIGIVSFGPVLYPPISEPQEPNAPIMAQQPTEPHTPPQAISSANNLWPVVFSTLGASIIF